MNAIQLSPIGCLNILRSVGYEGAELLQAGEGNDTAADRGDIQQAADCLARYIRFAEAVRKSHPDVFASLVDHHARPDTED